MPFRKSWALAVIVALLVPVMGSRSDAVLGSTDEDGGDPVPSSTRTFSDVPPEHPFFAEIEWLVGEGITVGFADGTFRPTWSITRGAMSTWLYRYQGSPAFEAPDEPTFPDVPASHIFFTEIEWAVSEGLIQGFPDGTFKPSRMISRQSMAALLYRNAGEPAFVPGSTPSFLDVPTTHVFFTEIEWAAKQAIIQGFEDGRFRPNWRVTRQTGAAFFFRADASIGLPFWGLPRQISFATVNEYLGDGISAAGPDGSLHVLWKESDQLLYRKLDAHGNTVIRTVDLGLDPAQSRAYALSHPTLAPQADGGAVVLWRYNVGSPQQPGIYGARIDATGRLAVGPRLVRPGFYSYLGAATDAAGITHLVVMENQTNQVSSSPSTASHRILLAALGADLAPVRPWSFVTSLIANNATNYPELAVEPDGTVHLVWFDARRFTPPYSTAYDLYYARVPVGDEPAVAPVALGAPPSGYTVSPDSSPNEYGPAITTGPDGTTWVAWVDAHDDVFLASVLPDGQLGLRGTIVDLGDFASQQHDDGLDLHVFGDGDVLLVVASGSADFPGLVQVRLDNTGAGVTAPVRIPVDAPSPGSDAWNHPSLTDIGGELQLVTETGFASTYDRMFVTTTAVGDPTDLPDLVVDDAHSTNISTSTPAKEGETVHVTVEATNAGWVPSPATTAEVRYDGSLVATVPVPSLGIDEVFAVEADWEVPLDIGVDPARIDVTIDPAGAVAETSEANNAVEHLVPLWLRPEGARMSIVGWDETTDTDRLQVMGATGFTATLTGTTEEGDPFTTSGTTTGLASSVALADVVPPGTYTVTGSGEGFALSESVEVTVTRDALDPYQITVTPSSYVDLWFNRWGSISGTVTSGGSPLAGATVTEANQGRVATTDAQGHFEMVDVASGAHTLAVVADGHARVQDQAVTVMTGEDTVADVAMVTTTVGYLDVTATNVYGAPLAAASIELLDSSLTVVDSCSASASGGCAFEPAAGDDYRVRVSLEGYVTDTTDPFDVIAGREYPTSVLLELDIGAVTAVDSDMQGWVAWYQSFCGGIVVPYLGCSGPELASLYGVFGTRFGLEYEQVGTARYVRSLDLRVQSAPLQFTVLLTELDVGGGIEIPVLIPDSSEEYTNVRVDALRLVNRATGEELWEYEGAPLYSNASFGQVTHLPDIAVPWTELAVEADLAIGKVAVGETGSEAWEAAPVLGGYNADRMRVTWVPSNGQMVMTAYVPGW